MSTNKTDNLYFNDPFQKGDFILLRTETKGIDERVLLEHRQLCITFPMGPQGRSLNLGVCVGVVLYDAVRQNYAGFEKITIPNTLKES
jgi:tRNA (cytidine/uridine-2'-O-)-methyltransferase